MLNATWFVLAGMGVVFLTLAVLVLVMTLLNRILGGAPLTPQAPRAPGAE